MEGPPLESEVIAMPIKVKKVNIETIENLKMANIGETIGMNKQWKV